MAIARDEVYIFPSWLTRLLVGDSSCEWSGWFKAHFKYAKLADMDWTSYRIRHTDLINQMRRDLETRGHQVLLERQAEFRIKGKTGILHGRPDLVAFSPEEAVLYEVKTGKPQPSHKAQLMVYLYGLGLALRQPTRGLSPGLAGLKGRAIEGVIAYEDGSEVRVPSTAIDADFTQKIAQLLRRISSATPAAKAPSSGECAYCNIPAAECPERATPDQVLEAETDEF